MLHRTHVMDMYKHIAPTHTTTRHAMSSAQRKIELSCPTAKVPAEVVKTVFNNWVQPHRIYCAFKYFEKAHILCLFSSRCVLRFSSRKWFRIYLLQPHILFHHILRSTSWKHVSCGCWICSSIPLFTVSLAHSPLLLLCGGNRSWWGGEISQQFNGIFTFLISPATDSKQKIVLLVVCFSTHSPILSANTLYPKILYGTVYQNIKIILIVWAGCQ